MTINRTEPVPAGQLALPVENPESLAELMVDHVVVPLAQWWLPWPPSINSYYRAIKRGKHATTILSKKGREYQEEAADFALFHQQGVPDLDGPLIAVVTLYPPSQRKRDIDNHLKAIFDVLTKVHAWNDDSQVKAIFAEFGPKRKPGFARVRIARVEYDYEKGAHVADDQVQQSGGPDGSPND